MVVIVRFTIRTHLHLQFVWVWHFTHYHFDLVFAILGQQKEFVQLSSCRDTSTLLLLFNKLQRIKVTMNELCKHVTSYWCAASDDAVSPYLVQWVLKLFTISTESISGTQPSTIACNPLWISIKIFYFSEALLMLLISWAVRTQTAKDRCDNP